MPIFEQYIQVTELCNQADLVSARFLRAIPKALSKHSLEVVVASLKSETGDFEKKLLRALSTLPTEKQESIRAAANSTSIEETRKLIGEQIDATLLTASVTEQERSALLPDLITHRRRFAKMRAALEQTALWEDTREPPSNGTPTEGIHLVMGESPTGEDSGPDSKTFLTDTGEQEP